MATITKVSAQIIVNEAFAFMAKKAGVSIEVIQQMIADKNKAATDYFIALVEVGGATVDAM